ncbi:TauD/TfdA family dioxygenase [Pseudonocardia ailaonensis]|uniref:TauD/TfdA family dioxygenase n=1 Tax=Pseudonocardia ailaonensis TaxID=367279 RepID=A0ABN2MIZ3_9PSEU
MTTFVPDVQKVAGRIGAEITGVDLAADLDDATVAVIRGAILEHKVVFLRGQHALDDAAHERFTARLGPLTGHPVAEFVDGADYVLEIDSERGQRANLWHTDVTFTDAPPAFSVLRAITIPPYGGDTQWANTVTAYQSLGPVLQRLADELWAAHTNAFDYTDQIEDDSEAVQQNKERTRRTEFVTEHPVVHVHPETGERALALGAFVNGIRSVKRADSARLFELFQSHITRAENTVRWRWAPGDVAIWDNRATQHYALYDYEGLHRAVRRVTVEGRPLVSVAGETSRTVTGFSWHEARSRARNGAPATV